MATKRKSRPAKLTAKTADPHRLYELSVQSVDSEIDFIEQTFRQLRKRPARRLREDFCGTANTSVEWVKRSPRNIAVGVDLHAPTLQWGLDKRISRLSPSQQRRITLLNRNVLDPGPRARRMDAILAMNFSYWIFKSRKLMKQYFAAVHASLVKDGVFFLDFVGGWECLKNHREVRPLKTRLGKFKYIWSQSHYNPISGDILCHISFLFPDGSRLGRAFTYDWRLWSIPELRDILEEVGFKKVTVYWEGDDGKGGGNGDFKPNTTGEVCASFISYIVAEK